MSRLTRLGTGVAVVIGPLPPPRHGLAVANGAAISGLEAAGWRVEVIDTSPGTLTPGLGYVLRRLWRFGRGAIKAVRLRRRQPSLIYCGLSGDVGLMVDLVLLRLVGGRRHARVLLHHHNFGYLEETTRWMTLLVKWGPRNAAHIVLCDEMATRLASMYSVPQARVRVVGNMALRRVGREQFGSLRGVSRPASRLVVGYLGTLSVAKGFERFVSVVGRLTSTGLPSSVEFRCAGPAEDPLMLELATGTQGLDYHGVLDRDAVSRFLDQVDILLFPSEREAQPNVILEALASSVSVVSTSVGCIPSLMSPHLADQICDLESFVDTASSVVLAAASNFSARDGLRQSAGLQFEALIELSQLHLDNWRTLVQM